MSLTVICHFFNEEYLLPWWLSHHRTIFDHGIMIDYQSTDRSREIISEMVPEWGLITSRNECFDAPAVDAEVNDYERACPGWKIVLNVTEFLCGDVRRAIGKAQQLGIRPLGVCLIDQPDEFGREPERHVPIHKQRHHGCLDEARRRLLHRYSWARYGIGRHNYLNNAEDADELTVVHLGLSPMTPSFIARKLQIQEKIPESNRRAGWGHHHIVDRDKLLRAWKEAQSRAIHLPSHPYWQKASDIFS